MRWQPTEKEHGHNDTYETSHLALTLQRLKCVCVLRRSSQPELMNKHGAENKDQEKREYKCKHTEKEVPIICWKPKTRL